MGNRADSAPAPKGVETQKPSGRGAGLGQTLNKDTAQSVHLGIDVLAGPRVGNTVSLLACNYEWSESPTTLAIVAIFLKRGKSV